MFGAKVLRIFKALFQKHLKAEVRNSSSDCWRQIKKRGVNRVFLCWHYQLGLSAPNPDTKDFSGKVLWNPKSFTKIKWYFRCKVLWRTFLSRKVRSGKVELCKSAVGGLSVSCGHIFACFIHCFHDKVE